MLRYSLVLLFLGGVVLLATPQVRAQSFQHDFRFCVGDYALCAASTCTPLPGVEIEVNTAGGGTRKFPAAQCTCPIFNGPAIADVNGGNMQGSCDPPPNNGVWSLYSPMGHIPQEINDWSKGQKQSAAPIFVCPADLNQGHQFANCFSFACVRAGKVKGNIEVATCTCPLGESLEGTPVPPHSEFATPAGQCNQDICFQHPVGAPFPFDDLAPGQCFSFD
jgi:hypothetical protein